MSDKEKRDVKVVEGQPLRALPMPEYRYQDRYAAKNEVPGTLRDHTNDGGTKPDLTGVTLNLL